MKKINVLLLVGFISNCFISVSFASDLRTRAMGDVSIGVHDPHSQALINPAKAAQIDRFTVYTDGGDIFTPYHYNLDYSYENTPPTSDVKTLEESLDIYTNEWDFPVVCFIPLGKVVLGGRFNYGYYNDSYLYLGDATGAWVGATYYPDAYSTIRRSYSNSINMLKYGWISAFKIFDFSIGLAGTFDTDSNLYTYDYCAVSGTTDTISQKVAINYSKSDYRCGLLWDPSDAIELGFWAMSANSTNVQKQTENTNLGIAQSLSTVTRERADKIYNLEGKFKLGDKITLGGILELYTSAYTDNTKYTNYSYDSEIYQSTITTVGTGMGYQSEGSLFAADFLFFPEIATKTQYSNTNAKTYSSQSTWLNFVLRFGAEKYILENLALRLGWITDFIFYNRDYVSYSIINNPCTVTVNYSPQTSYCYHTITSGLGYKINDNCSLDYCLRCSVTTEVNGNEVFPITNQVAFTYSY